MRKRLYLVLSSFLLFLTGCFSQGQDQLSNLAGPFAPILNFVDIILIKLPANMDANKALVHFIIWLLVFALVYTGVDKFFNRDGKKKGISLLISVIISIMGVIAIPNAFIQEIFRLYSNIFTWVLVFVPGLVGVYIAQTKFKGDNFAMKGMRVIIIAFLAYAYSVLINNTTTSVTGFVELDVTTVLTYGMIILSVLLAYYSFVLLVSMSSWFKSTSSSPDSASTFRSADKKTNEILKDIEKVEAERDDYKSKLSAEKKLIANLAGIQGKLVDLETKEIATLEGMKKAVDALINVLGNKDYAGHLNNPEIVAYIQKVLAALKEGNANFDKIKAEIAEKSTQVKARLDALSATHKKMFEGVIAFAGENRTKFESADAESKKLIAVARDLWNTQAPKLASELNQFETDMLKKISSAFDQMATDPNLSKQQLESAKSDIDAMEKVVNNLKELDQTEEKYLAKLVEYDEEHNEDLKKLFLDSKK